MARYFAQITVEIEADEEFDAVTTAQDVVRHLPREWHYVKSATFTDIAVEARR